MFINGRYIETFHIGDITYKGDNNDFAVLEDFWLKMKPEGNIGFKKPDAYPDDLDDSDDPSPWDRYDITEHKYEVLNTYGMVYNLDITYFGDDESQERTEEYIVYWEDWSDYDLDNLTFNPCQHTYIDEDGNLFMVISREHSLADIFPESLPDKTIVRERRVRSANGKTGSGDAR